MPEKELPKDFKIIELDNPQIGMIYFSKYKKYMAHASGKFDILTEEIFIRM